jgi:hypothetical protein
LFDGVMLPVETDENGLLVGDGLQMDGPTPQLVDVFEDSLGVVASKIDADVFVHEIELLAVTKVRVENVDERPTVVGELKEKTIFDLLEHSAFDLVVLRSLVVGE